MSKGKKILIYIVKLAVLFGVLAALGYVWVIFVFSMSGGLFSTPTPAESAITLIGTLLMIAGFIAFAVWFSRLGVETKTERASMSLKEKLRRPLMLIIPLILIVAFFMVKDQLEYEIRRAKAKIYYSAADEVIPYSGVKNERLMSTPLAQDSILINTKSKRVTFIYQMSFDDMVSIKLKPQDSENPRGLTLQYTMPLESGGTFNTYFYNDPEKERAAGVEAYAYTKGAELILEDGSCWYADLDNEYLGFRDVPVTVKLDAERCADEIITYGHTPLDGYDMGYDYGTLFIDYDAPRIYLLFSGRYTDGTSCQRYDLELSEGTGLENFVVQSSFELSQADGTLYACYFDNPYLDDYDLTRKIVIALANGDIYIADTGNCYGFENTDGRYLTALLS